MNYQGAVVWKNAMKLAIATCRCAAGLPAEERFGLRSQMTRAAVSVPSNIAEGWARESRKEKAQFLAIAHGSAAELNTQVLICRHLCWLSHGQSDPLLKLADEVGRMLTVMRRGLRGGRSEEVEGRK
jgi:four helix bundle protein